jgi:hypothetical protein
MVTHETNPGLWSVFHMEPFGGATPWQDIPFHHIDTFDGAKPRFLDGAKKRRSVSTLSILRTSGRGVEWVDFFNILYKIRYIVDETFRIQSNPEKAT